MHASHSHKRKEKKREIHKDEITSRHTLYSAWKLKSHIAWLYGLSLSSKVITGLPSAFSELRMDQFEFLANPCCYHIYKNLVSSKSILKYYKSIPVYKEFIIYLQALLTIRPPVSKTGILVSLNWRTLLKKWITKWFIRSIRRNDHIDYSKGPFLKHNALQYMQENDEFLKCGKYRNVKGHWWRLSGTLGGLPVALGQDQTVENNVVYLH